MRKAVIAGAAVAAALAVWWGGRRLGEHAPAKEAVPGAERSAREGATGRRHPSRVAGRLRPRGMGAKAVAMEAGFDGTRPDPMPVARREAQAALDRILEEIEELSDRRRRIRPSTYETWRRRAGAAFAALQVHLNPSDPRDAAELEEAHRQLARALASLERRVYEDPRHPSWMDAVP